MSKSRIATVSAARLSKSLLLASTAALLLLGNGVIVQAQEGNMPPTGYIQATLDEPSTFFRAFMSDAEDDPLTYAWDADLSCGLFQPGPPFGHPESGAEWKHGNDTDCGHQGDTTNHTGTIWVDVSDGTNTVRCEYEGSASGAGEDCEPELPSPSPSPTSSPSVECEVLEDGSVVVTGTNGPDNIEILPVEGSDIEIKVVVDGEVICTLLLSDVERLFVYGGGGDDTIVLSDEITKETRLYGGRGNDTISGGGGNDTITDSDGNNTINGGGGNDDILGGDGTDTINGGGGNDTIDGGGGNDTIEGGSGSNDVEGGKGDDSILDEIDEVIDICRAPRICDKSHDVFDGGPGDDRIIAGGGTDTVIGGPGNDYLRGGKDDDVIKGNDGRDDLDGQGGTDRLAGGKGNDTLRGGAGSGDRCDGGPGQDRIFVGGDKGCESYS